MKTRQIPGEIAQSVLIAGPLLGSHKGRVPSQGETLAAALRGAGVAVETTSNRLHPVGRLVDSIRTIARTRSRVSAAIVLVFSGRSFVIAELTAAAASVTRVPTVLWLHGGDLPRFARQHPRRVKRLLKMGALVVAPSHYLARELEWARPDIIVIPNALPLDEAYRPAVRGSPRPRLLWMRAFSSLYRPELAVEVLARVRAGGVDAELTMAGQDGPLTTAVIQQARRLGVDSHVNLIGFLDREEKLSAFADHDIFLSTNAIDNAPVSLLEAAASGVIVVAMNVGGVGDIFTDGVDAVLIPDADVAAMAQAVIDLVRGHRDAAQISEAAPGAADASNWPAVTGRWMGVLRDLRDLHGRFS